MKILVNARISAPNVAHGGPILARRHAEALMKAGQVVTLAAPEEPHIPDPAGLTVVGYEADPSASRYVPASRPNPGAERTFAAVLDTREDATNFVKKNPAHKFTWLIDPEGEKEDAGNHVRQRQARQAGQGRGRLHQRFQQQDQAAEVGARVVA